MSGCLALAALSIPSAATGQRPLPDIGTIDRTARAYVDSGFSGVVLVAWGDSVLLRRAYRPPGERLTADAAFWIASMTKAFTAAAVLRLHEEGRLRLTDSIGRFFPGAPRDKRSITIQQLLTHTSGLGGGATAGGISERSQAVQPILARELVDRPGHSYRYGDDDYVLLAAIIEVASGERWEDYVRTRLVRPARLRNAGFACRQDRRLSPPVAPSERARRSGMPVSRVACDWAHKGANGMFATADDLLRWSRALGVAGPLGAAGDDAIERPQVLVRQEPPFDIWYGYGVRVYTRGGTVVEVMHSGSGDDDHTGIVRSFPSGLTIIVLSNAGHHAGTTWSAFVARLLATREAARPNQSPAPGTALASR